MITGEERLREFLAGLYGDVSQYEGRPTDSQIARADALAHELDDVVKEFTAFSNKQVAALNRNLEAKKLPAIHVISEDEWRKNAGVTTNGGAGPATQFRALARVGLSSSF
jgi:hypothetical protein